jgi:hypothetical protein
MRGNAGMLPVLLDLDLLEGGWNGEVSPYPGIEPFNFACQSLRNALLKKFEDDKHESADKLALDKFLQSNVRCRDYPGLPTMPTNVEQVALGEAQDFIQRLVYSDEGLSAFTWSGITANFSFGNGANIGSPGTDFFSKTALSSMAATDPILYIKYIEAISSDPLWSSVESTRQEFRGREVVRGSRLSFVPKTRTISRTICTEPVLNMMFQKGAQVVLERLLKKQTGIDLSIQPDKNRELARQGSIDGRYGTIDLQSASDSLSLTMVRQMFPPDFVSILERMRCPLTILPDGSEVELHMISSMGNAFTFPLQTILFSSVVYGAYRSIGLPLDYPRGNNLGNFAVFGDDIIVRREAYDLVVKMLSHLGFVVNVDKSFNDGDFRESCGADFMSGHNVRGVYIRTLKTDGDVYSAINRLNVWSAEWGITLARVIHYLLKGVRFLRIPFDEMDDAGVKVPQSLLPNVKRCPYTGGIFYRCMVQRIRKINVADVESRPPSLRGWFKNYDGVLLAALAGTLRDASITPRTSGGRWRIKVRCSSRWDYIIPPAYSVGDFGDRWKSFAALNLSFTGQLKGQAV